MAPQRAVRKLAEADSVVVIGLGRFGGGLATELERVGTEVLGIDADEALVQEHAPLLTQVVRADCTSEEALRQLAVERFDRAVIAIGTHIEASLLTASLLLKMRVPQIWAKANTPAHAEILRQLGIEHVVSPESDMGRRLAHVVRGAMVDYIEFDPDYAMVKTQPPAECAGKTLAELQFRARYGVTVVGVRDAQLTSHWRHATPETVLEPGDWIIAAGEPRKTEAFALLN